MKVRFSERAESDYESLPPQVRKSLEKQLQLLIENFRHPSLRTKKYNAANNIWWQCRVNSKWRFFLQITGDEYVIAAIVPHPK